MVIPAVAFAVYCAAYLPLPSPPGGDAPYYLLGVRHLDGGRMAWGNEPPLVFLLLWPLSRVFGDLTAFTVLGAGLAAATIYLSGIVAARAIDGSPDESGSPGARPSPAVRPAALPAVLLAQALAFAYCSPQLVSCFLKNGLANLLMLIAVAAWYGGTGPRRLAPFTALLAAVFAHPGAVAPLAIAVVLSGLPSPAVWARRPHPGQMKREGRGIASLLRGAAGIPGAGRPLRPMSVVAGALLTAAAATAVALPAAARYALSYLRPSPEPSPAFASWDLAALAMRYWPLWIGLGLAAVARLCAALRTSALPSLSLADADAGPARADAGPAAQAASLKRFLWVWTFALVGLSVVGGQAGRRLELQLYLPLAPLAAAYAHSWLPRSRVRAQKPAHGPAYRAATVTAAIVVGLALVFGLCGLSAALRQGPLLNEAEMQSITEVIAELPHGSKVVTHGTNTAYWVEYLTGVPLIRPNLIPERGLVRGPTYLLTENPTRAGQYWSETALHALAAGGRQVWRTERFVLWAADDNPDFFETWQREPHRSALELLPIDQEWHLPDIPMTAAGFWTKAVGWALFAPAGLLMAARLNGSVSAPLGLVVSYLIGFWLVTAVRSYRRRHCAGS